LFLGQIMIILGAHLSIAGGLHKSLELARKYECNALQIFTKNSNTWKERFLRRDEIEKFHRLKEDVDIVQLASHTSYLINIASPDDALWSKSVVALENEFTRSSQLGIPFIVLHPGAHRGAGERSGILRIALAINRVFERTKAANVMLLLETTAGQGTQIGYRFEQLAEIAEKIEDKSRLGFCLDTCHVFAAGYDISDRASYENTLRKFDSILGLDNLCLLHLNDSKKPLGSRIDRHEHIGEGCIGEDAFGFIMNDPRLEEIPKIIETPKHKNGVEQDPVNLAKLRSMVKRGYVTTP